MNPPVAHAAWLHPRLAAQVIRPRRDGRAEIALRVEGLDTPRQVLLLDERLHALPGVSRVAIDARAQRVRIVWNPERLALDATRARRMGFGGKLCIHPAQVQPLHAVFDPDTAAVTQAQRLRQALAEAGGGVCVLDGRMVDAPVLHMAQQTLARHAWALQRMQRNT